MSLDRVVNHRLAVSAGLTLVLAAGEASAQTAVTTYHNDLARMGAYTTETVLTPATVASSRFGKRWSYAVNGAVYAQPLYVPHVNITVGLNKGVHNVVFIATEQDVVYAFDADRDPSTLASPGPLWQSTLIPNGETYLSDGDIESCWDMKPDIGITSTPVIDPVAGTLYTIARTKDGSSNYYQRLHALSLATGLDRRTPTTITASLPGTGDGGSTIVFDPRWQNQRSGLVLSRGIVYAAWGSHCDFHFYHGWVMGFSASTLQPVPKYAFLTTPNTIQGGIWEGGGAPAVDALGNLYFETGNAIFDVDTGGADYGDSVVKLKTIGGLSVADYFTPSDQGFLNAVDGDLGSTGIMLLPDQPGPHRHLAVGAGKEGIIYLLDRDNLGKYVSGGPNAVVQELNPGSGVIGGVWGMPAYWNGHVYYGASGEDPSCGPITSFTLQNGLLSTAPVSQSPDTFCYTGTSPAVSASGTHGGIVWGLDISGWNSAGHAELRAYDALDVSRELFRSGDNPADQAPLSVKFTVPTVANGRVYVGGRDEVAVYGLTGAQFALPNFSVTEGAKAVITVKRLPPATGILTVDYATSNGTAQDGTNYTGTSGTLTFASGVTTKTFLVTTLQDTLNEPGRTVLLGIKYTIAGVPLTDTAILTLKDNDPAGQIAFGTAAYGAKQTAPSATITVRRIGGTAAGASVHYATTTGGTATDGIDYTATSGSLTFAVGQTALTFPVAILPSAAADDHTVNLALTSPGGGATLGATPGAVLTIAGSGATVAFSAANYAVSQSGTSATITVVRHGPLTGTATVVASTSAGTATNGVDYADVTVPLTFKPGISLQTFKVSLLKDTTVEGAETVNLNLSSPTGAGLGVQQTATLNISSASPNVHFSTAAYKVSQALGKTNVTVTRGGSLAGTVTVDYKATDGTAVSGTDYSLPPDVLSFGPGVASRYFPVTVLPDSVHDGDETVNLLLGTTTLTGAYLATPSTAVLTITDTAPSRLQLAVADSGIGEGAGHAAITVTRTGSTTTTVTVHYTTVDLSPASDAAQPGVNYTTTSGTLSLAPGETSATFAIPVLNDGPSSSTRVGVALSNPTGGAALGSLTTGTLWIVDGQ